MVPPSVYVLEFSARLAWARLVRERSFMEVGDLRCIEGVLRLATLTPRNLEEFMVRSLALAGIPAPFNSQFGSAWHRNGGSAIEDLALAAARHCLRQGLVGTVGAG